jgi:hypothetical protein
MLGEAATKSPKYGWRGALRKDISMSGLRLGRAPREGDDLSMIGGAEAFLS